ncbi:GNAT family N-acetyltransferase [Actinocorallia sp. A-T 12471]|uniref:GNAT family N-acetyltransferase n=1 Tax=Actinocorallia sp. A-T 12471 TaxID=3089813 RepID=UPI0029D12DC5|nr:GNAT family N-acetyltransferase [Actinocorallia sp. A-T 12471]MDX6738460.1 GNAT family N-acetyltransferase [Actinocorallia sp. A-T 12471]
MSSAKTLRLATEHDVAAITGLIDRTGRWLRTKGTDQWARPWPDAAARAARIRAGLVHGRTLLVERGGELVGTVSMTSRGDPSLWRPHELLRPALYLHRLAVDRSEAGSALGVRLLDWTTEWARLEYGAECVRIDVWNDNAALHAYYTRIGFTFVDPDPVTRQPRPRLDKRVRPSSVLLERRIAAASADWPSSAAFTLTPTIRTSLPHPALRFRSPLRHRPSPWSLPTPPAPNNTTPPTLTH